jgi:protein phosphatase
VITRAVGVASDVEVDALSLTLRDGDRLVLCSDGLTGVVDDAAIARAVREERPEAAVDLLVAAANEAGGPDNITIVVVTVEGGSDPDATVALPRVVRIRTDEVAGESQDWASRYSDLGGGRVLAATPTRGSKSGPRSGTRSGPSRSSRERLLGGTFDRVALRVVIAFVVTAALVAGLALGGRLIIDRAYLVGVEGEEVVIYRGFDVQLGPIDLKRVHERPGVLLVQVPPALRPVYEAGRPAADLGDARRIVRNIPLLESDVATGAGAG